MCPAKHKNEILSCPLLQSRVFPLAQFHGVGAPFKTRARPLWVTYFNGKGVFCLSLSHTLCLVLVYAVLPITIMITCHAKLWLHVRCRRFWSRFLAQATSFNPGVRLLTVLWNAGCAVLFSIFICTVWMDRFFCHSLDMGGGLFSGYKL